MKKMNPFELPQMQDVHLLPSTSTSDGDSHRELDSQRNELGKDFTQTYSSNPDLFNIVLMEQQQSSDLNRPRQYGRRSEPMQLSNDAINLSNTGAAVSCCNKSS